MPATEKPTANEKTDRLGVESEIRDIDRALKKEAPRLEKVKQTMDNAEQMLKNLQVTTLKRVAALQEEDLQKLAMEDWNILCKIS